MGLFDKKVQRQGKGLFSSGSDPYSLDSINSQIDNANKRIEDAGYSKQNADPRNGFEKFTNLPQGQNWFFDTLELLGRPGNAIKNVIDYGLQGRDDTGSAIYKGLSGQEKVSGVDITGKLGMENKAAKFVTGLALDIGTDPLTYVPGGVILKGAKGAGKLAAAPVKAGYNALESASPALKTFRETQAAPALESFKDGFGYMFKPEYKIQDTLSGGKSDFLKTLAQQTDNSRQYMQENTLSDIGKIARDAGGLDKGVDTGRLVEAPLKQFEDVQAYEFPDGLKRTENKQDLYSTINDSRQTIKGLNKDIGSTKQEYQKAIGSFAQGLGQTDNEIRKLYMGLERQAGKNADAATRQNIREAGRELARIDSQLSNFGQNETSLLRNVKKQIKDNHESTFDLAKQIRQVAPNGISGVARDSVPSVLRNLVRTGGKGIDEIADELGYTYADDLMQDMQKLNRPRKLDDATVEQMARQEMARSGAVEQLAKTKADLEAAKGALQASVQGIRQGAAKANTAKATEQAFADLSQHPKYIELSNQRAALKAQYDALKGESSAVKQAKIDEIKKTEDEINALREAAKNPVMVQKEIARPARELSTDPKIQKAAQELVQKNQTIRDFAEQNGIDIPELEGYMTHVWSQEERARRLRVSAVDRGANGTGNPKKSILNNRTLTGSAEDVNDKIGRNFFEPNAFYASAIGQKRLIDYIHAVSFRRKVLSNTDFAKPFKKGMDVPKDAEVIDTANYKFLKDSGDPLSGLNLADEVGGQYLVTKQAKQLLDRYQKLNTDEGTKAFLKMYDTIQSFWKRGALFSLGYHVRNQAGAMFNNYVGGMNPLDLAKYTQEGFQEVARAVGGKGSELFDEYRKQGLSSSALSQVEFAKFGEEPEKAIEKTVKNLSKDTKGQITQRLNPLNAFQTSQEVGNFFDQANRFALYKWAREAKKMTPEEAAAKVREVQFDYSKVTPFERNVVTRVVPFYRWMKNNIPFQIKQFVNDPRKYEYLNKARVNAQATVGLNDENIPDYMKENFSIPIYGDQGKGKFLGLNLPLGDLTKLSRPGKTLVDAVTPLVKTPAELALNYNTFRGKQIQKFEGQEKKYSLFGQEFGIPIKTAYGLEQATGQIGRGLSGFLQKPENVDQDTLNRLPSLGISSLTKDFDAQKFEYYSKLDQLKQMQDLMLFIQQQTGEKPRTLAEIKKAAH